MNFCTDYNFLNGILIIKFFYNAALIIFPIIIIAIGSYESFKAVMSGNQEDLKAIAFKGASRIASVLIILLLPNIIKSVFINIDGFDGINNNITKCLNNADKNIIAGLKRAHEKELQGLSQNTATKFLASYNAEKYKNKSAHNQSVFDNPSYDYPSITPNGQGNFMTYDLTDEELTGLAYQCYREQGTPEGAAAEASLMANRFELYGGGYGTGASGLYNYVKNSNWFAGASNIDGSESVDEDIKAAVRSVLVEGKRTLPGYVDEHDCIFCGEGYGYDIVSATNNGTNIDVDDRSQYTPYVTILNNRYGSSYTFYSFPTPTSDPFGYTSEENRTRIGDDCYPFGG